MMRGGQTDGDERAIGVMKSMTGFGSASVDQGDDRVTATIQSLNHRSVEIVVRLPEELRSLELELRSRIAAAVRRGRYDLLVRVERPTGSAPLLCRVDRNGLERFFLEVRDLVQAGTLDRAVSLGDLMRSPFVEAVTPEPIALAQLRAPLFGAVDAALSDLERMKSQEGGRLAVILGAGFDSLAAIVERIAERRALVAATTEESLRRRLDELLSGGAEALPPERLAQEVVLLVDRSDVREEIDRLGSHLAAVSELVAQPGPHGRRLDFFVQEMQRELNTLGAKSRDSATTRAVVDAKVVAEQLREQIQNVE